MCYFVTIGVKSENIESLESFRTAGFQLSPAKNPIVSEALGTEYEPYYVTDGHCSCSIQAPGTAEIDEKKLHRKYKKKGWSDRKINRAMSSLKTSSTSKRRSPAIDIFLQAVEDVVMKNGSILVFVHFYSGEQDAEHIEPEEPLNYSLDEFKSSERPLPEDTVVTISL